MVFKKLPKRPQNSRNIPQSQARTYIDPKIPLANPIGPQKYVRKTQKPRSRGKSKKEGSGTRKEHFGKTTIPLDFERDR